MGEGHPLSNFMSHRSHAHIIILLPASCVPDVISDPFPPHGFWDSQSKWFKSCPCWVQEHMVTFFKLKYMHASEGKKLVKMRQRDSWISLLGWTPWSPFLSTSKFSDLPEPLSSCEKRRNVWSPIWKTSLPILIFWAPWLFRMSSLFYSFLSYWGLASPSLCVYITRLIPADTFC